MLEPISPATASTTTPRMIFPLCRFHIRFPPLSTSENTPVWCGSFQPLPRRFEPQDVPGLAGERVADRLECREANRARLAGLQDREVGQRHPDLIRELGQ